MFPPLMKSNIHNKDFVLSIDYAPTILDLAGVNINPYIQGRSFLPLLTGKTEEWRKSFLIEYYSFENPFPWLIDTDYKAIRNERYKYIHWIRHQGKNELYDLANDPYEMNNLYNDEAYQKIVEQMEKDLALLTAESFGISK